MQETPEEKRRRLGQELEDLRQGGGAQGVAPLPGQQNLRAEDQVEGAPNQPVGEQAAVQQPGQPPQRQNLQGDQGRVVVQNPVVPPNAKASGGYKLSPQARRNLLILGFVILAIALIFLAATGFGAPVAAAILGVMGISAATGAGIPVIGAMVAAALPYLAYAATALAVWLSPLILAGLWNTGRNIIVGIARGVQKLYGAITSGLRRFGAGVIDYVNSFRPSKDVNVEVREKHNAQARSKRKKLGGLLLFAGVVPAFPTYHLGRCWSGSGWTWNDGNGLSSRYQGLVERK